MTDIHHIEEKEEKKIKKRKPKRMKEKRFDRERFEQLKKANLSMDQIAVAMGVSRRTLYRYTTNK